MGTELTAVGGIPGGHAAVALVQLSVDPGFKAFAVRVGSAILLHGIRGMRACWGLGYGGQHTSDQQQPHLPAQARQLELLASDDYLKAYIAACVFSSTSSRSARALYWYCWLMYRTAVCLSQSWGQ
jgi:hypothetical protein